MQPMFGLVNQMRKKDKTVVYSPVTFKGSGALHSLLEKSMFSRYFMTLNSQYFYLIFMVVFLPNILVERIIDTGCYNRRKLENRSTKLRCC